MKRIIKTVSFGLLIGLMACEPNQRIPDTDPAIAVEFQARPKRTKKIKLAILLDTSGSMDGLIEQAKNQLWKIVNQLALAKDEDGDDPEIEIALYQYGNDGLSAMNGYVQQISGFTTELDEISEQLFALRTNGGSEFCGTVIHDAISNLEWSTHEEDLQLIFIAGNEAFSQGSLAYEQACKEAINNNIIVNTIFCGDYYEGVRIHWNDGAAIGLGKYMNIDHDAKVVHIDSPYDEDIAELNTGLNQTYIPYGTKGQIKKRKQLEQDANASSLSKANATKRYISKGGKVYKNTSWDLVDASEKKGFEIEKIQNLPTNMQQMTNAEKMIYMQELKKQRNEIKSQIADLSKKRSVYVKQQKLKNTSSTVKQLDNVMVAAIRAQAIKKSFQFK